jgi:hypothetical protein
MPGVNSATDRTRAVSTNYPFRRTIVAVESLVGLRGGRQYSTPRWSGHSPVSVLSPFRPSVRRRQAGSYCRHPRTACNLPQIG